MMSRFMVSSTGKSKATTTIGNSRAVSPSFLRIASCLSPFLVQNSNSYGMAFLHSHSNMLGGETLTGGNLNLKYTPSFSSQVVEYASKNTQLYNALPTSSSPIFGFGAASAPIRGGLLGNFPSSHVRLFATTPNGISEPSYRVQASHILVKEESDADQIMQQLKDEEKTFAEIAIEKSDCPSKAKGGDLGAFGRGEMVPEFETACFENEAGALVKTKTQFGWHIIQVGQKTKMPSDIDAGIVKEWIDTNGVENYQLIDVREQDEIEKASVKEFQHLPLSEIQKWGPEVMAGEKLEKGKPTIVMCHHGMRSMQVAMFLSGQAGFEDVYNVAGGIDAYARQVDESIGRY